MKKIVKVSAVITTAVVLTGCSGGSGGNSASNDNYYDNPTNPIIPGIDPIDPTKPEQGGYPAYYLNEELGGQRFVAANTDWYYKEQAVKNQEFTDAYTDAKRFMDAKVAELSQMLAGQDYNPFYEKIDTALKQINRNQNIGDNINANYAALAPIFASLEDPYVTTNDEYQYNRFKASYHKLAANAYNNSLGHYKNSPSLPANREMKNLPENIFVQELALANLTYDELTVDKAKEIMNGTLTMVGDQAGTGSLVLKKVVELALYNESLYGLNDLAAISKVDTVLRERRRSLNKFDTAIYNARHNINTQSIDDCTM